MPRPLVPLFAPLLLALLGVQAFGQAPALVLSQSRWDFGPRDQGEKDELVIDVKNPGETAVAVTKVGVTCGCVRGAMVEETIPAGASGKLVLKLDTTRQAGPIAKHVWLETSVDARKIIIPITGDITPVWWTDTRSVNFGVLSRGQASTQSFRIFVNPRKKVALQTIRNSSSLLGVKTTPFREESGESGYEVSVTVGDDLPVGRFVARIEVVTDNELKPVDVLTVSAEVQGDIILKPQRLQFGGVKRDTTTSAEIEITGRGGNPLVIKDVACSDRRITTRVQEVDPGKRFVIHVTCTATGTMTRITGRIHVFTDDPDQRMLVIPYQGAIRP